jgi:hypothetical protein
VGAFLGRGGAIKQHTKERHDTTMLLFVFRLISFFFFFCNDDRDALITE